MNDGTNRHGGMLLLVALATALFVYLIRDFLVTIAMAAIFSGLLYPLFGRISGRLGDRRHWAAAATCVLFVLIVMLPASLLAVLIYDQAQALLAQASDQLAAVDASAITSELPQLEGEYWELLARYQDVAIEKLGSLLKSGSSLVIASIADWASGTVRFLFSSFVFVFTLYYLLLEGDAYLRQLARFLPFSAPQQAQLLVRFKDVSKATIAGTVVLNLIQGVVGAIGMYVAGVPQALFWGVVLAVASIIPGLGTMTVWGPAALYLIFTGQVTEGLALLAYGFLVISKVDNLLRPKLVGESAGLPDLMVFFSTMGGIALFGLAGITLGPIIAAVFLFAWQAYGELLDANTPLTDPDAVG